MKQNMYIIAIFMFVMMSCTAAKNNYSNNSLLEKSTPPIAAVETLGYTDESLAAAMMEAYREDDSVDYQIVNDPFPPYGDESLTFDFIEVTSEEIENLTMAGWEDVTSSNADFRAFIACEFEKCQPRLFVEDLANTNIFEVTFSMRMTWRPLSSLTWIDDNILAFSQFSNPHYGFRFAVDISQRKHLLTLVIADECFISDNCGG